MLGTINKVDMQHVRLTELHAAHDKPAPSYLHPQCKGNHTKYTPKKRNLTIVVCKKALCCIWHEFFYRSNLFITQFSVFNGFLMC